MMGTKAAVVKVAEIVAAETAVGRLGGQMEEEARGQEGAERVSPSVGVGEPSQS